MSDDFEIPTAWLCYVREAVYECDLIALADSYQGEPVRGRVIGRGVVEVYGHYATEAHGEIG